MSDACFRTLAREAAARYKPAGRFAYHFALGKLTADPAFVHILAHGLIPHGSRILDLGCGQGLLAALFETARHRPGAWPAKFSPPPDPVAYCGIDAHARDIERATCAVGGSAHFVYGDIRREPLHAVDVVILLDVLHYLDYGEQDELLRRAQGALADDGVLLLRVGDASRGMRFRYTVAIDRLVMTMCRHRVDRLHCRPLAAWIAALVALDFDVTVTPMSRGTPFANVLLLARYHRRKGNGPGPAFGVHDDELPGPRPRAHTRGLSCERQWARSMPLRRSRS
ncbi:MAG TPA: class I SAM-dependent methyltransferase [Casimicrobiaceae bacterium]|nr:class I SAM-dependent methyltransferase [Casimicrobiaceae bacterium]